MSERFELSIVIPAYNEASRIGKSLYEIMEFIQAQSYRCEVILSDDGSTDRTVALAREKLCNTPHKILESPRNRGKGHAVRQGMLAASGRYVIFTDADLSTPICEAEQFLRDLKGGFDCVIGSRGLADSKVEVRQNWVRELMGRIFNRFARFLSFKGINDSQCGFKGFRSEAARDLFAMQKLDGFSFDAEILYLAQRKGYRILERPVVWRNSPQSRVSILSDPFKMIFELLMIRWLHRRDCISAAPSAAEKKSLRTA